MYTVNMFYLRNALLCPLLQRRVMELKRASLILNTPPVTPRNSLLLTAPHSASASSSGEKMFDLQEFLTRGHELGNMRQSISEIETEYPLSNQPATEFRSQGSGISSQGLSQGLSTSQGLSQQSDGQSATELNVGANSNNNNNCDSSVGSSAFEARGISGHDSIMSMDEILNEFDVGVGVAPSVAAPPITRREGEYQLTLLHSTASQQMPTYSQQDVSNRTLSVQHHREHSRSFNSGLNTLTVPIDPALSRSSQTLPMSASTDMLSGEGTKPKKKGKEKSWIRKVGSKKKRHGSSEALSSTKDIAQKPPSGKTKKNKLLLEPRGPLYGGSNLELHRHSMNTACLSELTNVHQHSDTGASEVGEERGRRSSYVPAADDSVFLTDFLQHQISPGDMDDDEKSFWQEYGQI